MKKSQAVYRSHIKNVVRFTNELDNITFETNRLALEANLLDADKLSQKVPQEKIDALNARFEVIRTLLTESLNDLRTYMNFHKEEDNTESEEAEETVGEPQVIQFTKYENIFEFRPKPKND
jgi:hypothetical protein